ncbi:protein-glutamine gamma-glutamyltransferase [Sporobacter termitidis DSM 10068]|uniref:Protein-glutamine gamma-glutamyltransferase n=1 Tax=Sporobacter termitidis DSM 10068 TaxID=1123282 RepID=A0A1M5Z4K7_9FIRM|nr:protein-glutamine gamma-glutamyltransferase [Sporobacter termitidis]SHI19048.1 protein-glutamine gamma-glutamyltransferase [Sporobacter termitidis DSM 10068]
MILVDNRLLDASALDYPEGSMERSMLNTLSSSPERYTYDSLNQLKFELRMRKEIVAAANALNRSNLSFEVFRDSRCNPTYWRRRGDGGFELKPGVRASDAIRDIYRNSSRYGTECATAMQIIYYKALVEIFPEDAFNRMFPNITLMNWHDIAPQLREVGMMHRKRDYLPGDRRYFPNPDVDPETPEWQGENVIVMGDGTYYGHGMGRHRPDAIIRALNENRRRHATREAYLMDSAAEPDFKRFSNLYDQAAGGA